MNKTDPPTSFGVFNPVGHTVIAFDKEADLQAASAALLALGFAPASMVRYTAAEMSAQVASDLLSASPLASFGYELDLIRHHGDLAKRGCVFLVVDAPTDELAAQVAELVRTIKPVTAQHYGSFMIEDLTEAAPGRMGD